MCTNQKTEQQGTDKFYHIYDEHGLVTHSVTEEDFDLLYDATKQEYIEVTLDVDPAEEHSY